MTSGSRVPVCKGVSNSALEMFERRHHCCRRNQPGAEPSTIHKSISWLWMQSLLHFICTPTDHSGHISVRIAQHTSF